MPMKRPEGLLKLGTPVVTNAELSPGTRLTVHPKHMNARRADAKGAIAGVASRNGDVYWVKHNDDDEQIAAYGVHEFELDDGQPHVHQELIRDYAGNPDRVNKLFRYMRQYIKDCRINDMKVNLLPAYSTGMRAMRKHQPHLAAILEIEAQGLRRLGEEEPLFLHDLTSKEILASATAKALAGRKSRRAPPSY